MFSIDVMSRIPVYEQIIKQVEDYVLKDILKPGTQIPSVRNLSVSLSVNPNTIQKAFSELDRRGLIYSSPGKGTFISADAKEILSSAKRERIGELEQLMYELALAGISREQMVECVENVFNNKEEISNDKSK